MSETVYDYMPPPPPRDPDVAMPEQDYPRAFCAHRSGIEHVEVTQPKGQKYEWWRCLLCHCEFRPTGQPRPGDGAGEVR